MHGGTQINTLHGLRGIAALTVVVGHARGFADLPIPQTAPAMGVMLFFALSGFLMTHLYLDKSAGRASVMEFLVNRFARVWPLFAVVCVAMAFATAAGFGAGTYRMTPERLVLHLVGAGDSSTIWTISTEFQFYAVFTIIWIGFALTGRSVRALTAFLLVAIALLWVLGFPGDRIELTAYFQVFAGGMLAALILPKSQGVQGAWKSGTLLAILLIGYFAAFLTAPMFIGSGRWVYNQIPLVLLVSALVLLAVTAEHSWFGRLLGSHPMKIAGDLSFGIYLLHETAILALGRLLPDDGLHWSTRLAVLLAVTVAAAAFVYATIEVPARKAIREAWRRRVATPSPSKA